MLFLFFITIFENESLLINNNEIKNLTKTKKIKTKNGEDLMKLFFLSMMSDKNNSNYNPVPSDVNSKLSKLLSSTLWIVPIADDLPC